MNIVYEYVNISASERLEKIVEDKMEQLHKRYPFIIRGDVFLKMDNKEEGSQHHCGIRLSLPGPRTYASSNENSFEEAIAETFRDLKDLLEKKKGKMKNY